jgi:8-amino-7-oxononanoate synthase
MNPLESALAQRRGQGLARSLTPLLHAPSKSVVREGVLCLNCASNNYLDLAGHPRLTDRAREALDQAGTGSGGSRLLGGNLPLHEQLESALSRYRPLGKALLFNSGYQANATAVSALGDALGGVFADKLCHASVAEGLRLSQAPFHRFRHNDLNHLEELLKARQPEQGGLVVTETLFSMDGDFAPLEDLAALQRRYGFWLLLDEAHSTGCYPGLQETALRGLADRLVLLGTFGKALGGFGAYVAGPPEAVDYLVNFGRGFIFSTSLPPAVLGSNLGALEALEEEAEAWRPAQLQRISAYAREELQKRGLDLGSSQSHIAPVRLGSPERASLVSAFLFDHGIHAPAIRPPTVPPGTSRLRINFTAAFSEEDVTRLGDALEAALQSAQAAPRA